MTNVTDVKTELGRVIKGLRNKQAITQEELAAKALLHRTYVSDIERGARNPSLETLVRLAEALQIPLAEIFRETEAVRQTRIPPQ
ncbi:MAG TPA: helix-turn-helix transcriptional regulator [Verrucomicrobiae bacterium]|nr:helix-turn-helix transcriptional regulator [Verrucomicrobiae bacterium]